MNNTNITYYYDLVPDAPEEYGFTVAHVVEVVKNLK